MVCIPLPCPRCEPIPRHPKPIPSARYGRAMDGVISTGITLDQNRLAAKFARFATFVCFGLQQALLTGLSVTRWDGLELGGAQ